MYGGNDQKWIKEFEEKTKFITTEAHHRLELVSFSKLSTVQKQETSIIDSFWTRLESLWFSKIQRHSEEKQDFIMEEIQKIINLQKTGCWTLVCKGSNVLTSVRGSVALSVLLQFNWKKEVSIKGFDVAFMEYTEMIISEDRSSQECCHFYFPMKAGKVPAYMICPNPNCLRTMEKFIAFQCCHTDDKNSIC